MGHHRRPKGAKETRIRGISFKHEYRNGPGMLQQLKNKINRVRAPSMISESDKHMIPPQAKEDIGKVTVVLDLDETLIYARDGPLHARPGLDNFLATISPKVEVVVWTAGVRAYAQAVVKNIDKKGIIKHCVYRHKKWFTGCAGYNKDLTLLGRNMNKLIIVENTPDCVRGNEQNGIVLTDYEGAGEDMTLEALRDVLIDCVDAVEGGSTVPDFIKSTPSLERRRIPSDTGGVMDIYCIDTFNFVKSKEHRINRDIPGFLPNINSNH